MNLKEIFKSSKLSHSPYCLRMQIGKYDEELKLINENKFGGKNVQKLLDKRRNELLKLKQELLDELGEEK